MPAASAQQNFRDQGLRPWPPGLPDASGARRGRLRNAPRLAPWRPL